jgi:hypothetical protein
MSSSPNPNLNELLSNINNDDELYVDNGGLSRNKSVSDISSSWALLVSEESVILEDKPLNNSQVIESKIIPNLHEKVHEKLGVDDILLLEVDGLKDLNIISNQVILVTHTRKHLKHLIENTQIDKLISIFDWIMLASKTLSARYALNINIGKLPKIDSQSAVIPRSSYKFCDYNYECEFHYGKKKRGCYAQHFVHHLVYFDVSGLLKYIIVNKNTPDKLNINEMNKTINTLLFVLNHMHDEMQNIDYFGLSQKSDSDKISDKKESQKPKINKDYKKVIKKGFSKTKSDISK